MENKLAIGAVLFAILAALLLILTGNNPLQQEKKATGAGFHEVITGYRDVENITITEVNETEVKAVPQEQPCGVWISLPAQVACNVTNPETNETTETFCAGSVPHYQEYPCAHEIATIIPKNITMRRIDRVPIIEMQPDIEPVEEVQQ
ncbi:Uncharacterised protein [Candidatus Anstonella stagnisolia]|nr:Uncharacterised protein [Candidatus Anstonella stagnisolia]